MILIKKVKQSINDLKINNSNIDPHILWELIKGSIRNENIKCSNWHRN
jgi:hypothetical protein